MRGHIASIHRHPVKGFTPERLDSAALAPGEPFPCDRLYAVENGPSGFDAESPAFVPKQKFAVLAAIPAVVIYNFFTRLITNYRAQLSDASANIKRLASRDLDRPRQSLRVAAQ